MVASDSKPCLVAQRSPKPANEYHLKTGNESGVWDIDTRGGL